VGLAAALDEERMETDPPQLGGEPREIHALSRRAPDLRARHGLVGATDDDGAPRLGTHPQAPLDAPFPVEQHAHRVPPARQIAHREPRIVGQRGAGADEDRVHPIAEPVHVGACGLAGDPLRLPGARGDAAVEGHGRLERHVGATQGGDGQERLDHAPASRLGLGERPVDGETGGADPIGAASVTRHGVVEPEHDTPCPRADAEVGAGRGLAR
jgi:hypothetical protein